MFAANARTVPTLSTYVLVFNTHRGPFADPEVRKAVARALEVDVLARAFGRAVTPARSLLPPGLLGHDAGRAAPARARAPQTFDLDVNLLVAPVFRARYARYAQSVLEILAQLGIRVKTHAGVAVPSSSDHQDAYIGRWVGDYPDPDSFMHDLLHSTAGAWGTLVGSPALDARVERIRFELDAMVRDSLCRDVEAAIADNAWLIPLFHDRLVLFAHPSVRGLTDDIVRSSGTVDYEALSIDD